MSYTNYLFTKRRENATTDKLNLNSPFSRKDVSLIFRWLEVVRSLPLPDDFNPSENQTTKKWKRVFTPSPSETQAGEYEVIIGVGSNDYWCITRAK